MGKHQWEGLVQAIGLAGPKVLPFPRQSIVAQRLEHPVVSRAGMGSSPIDTAKQDGARSLSRAGRGESHRYC